MALRAQRYVPAVYFGRPGALVALPYPAGGIARPYDRSTYDFINGAGGHRISQLIGGSRPYTLSWSALHVDNYALLEKYWTGNMGIGPWAIIDPAMTNMLDPNQAGATSQQNNAAYGWQKTENIASFGDLWSNMNPTFIHRDGAPRSLQWLFDTAPAAYPVMWPTKPYGNWHGWPIVQGQSYAFSCWMRPDGVIATNVTIAAKLQWLTVDGTYISETSSGDLEMTGWQKYTAIGIPPVTAAYVRPIFVATGSTIPTGGSLYIDELMLEQDSVINDWAPGAGVRPVEILGLTDVAPFATRMREGVKLDLREVS